MYVGSNDGDMDDDKFDMHIPQQVALIPRTEVRLVRPNLSPQIATFWFFSNAKYCDIEKVNALQHRQKSLTFMAA